MKNEILVPLAVLVANVSGIAISLIAPALLPPVEYSNFALSLAVGQFLAVLMFEWLRFPALRFSAGLDAELAHARGRVIAVTYRWVAIGALALTVGSTLFLGSPGGIGLVPFALFYGVSQGTFDGRQAFVRAVRDNLSFARTWAIRALISVILVVAAAWTTRSGWAATVALSLSFPISLLIGGLIEQRRRALPARPRNTQWAELPRLARYGMLAAVSGVIANTVPTVIRWAVVEDLGNGGAAGILLAADLSHKALSVAGLAVNVVAMQNSFRAVDSGDGALIRRYSQKQIAWTFLAVVPIGLLVILLAPDLARVLIRETYRPAFVAGIGACALASGLICIRLFAIDPLFYAFERPGLSVAGAAVSLTVCLLGLALENAAPVGLDPLTVFWSSAAVGLLVTSLSAIFFLGVSIPWSQLVRISLAAGGVLLLSRVLPHGSGLLGLAGITIALGASYLLVVVALDVCESRSQILMYLLRRARSD